VNLLLIAQVQVVQIDPVALWALIGLIFIIVVGSIVNSYRAIKTLNEEMPQKTLDALYLQTKRACRKAVEEYDKGLPPDVDEEVKVVVNAPAKEEKAKKTDKTSDKEAGFGNLSINIPKNRKLKPTRR